MALTRLSNQSLTSVTALPAAISTGKILQYKQKSLSGNFETSSTSYQDVISDTITPSSSSNKIQIIMDGTFQSYDSSSNQTGYAKNKITRAISGGASTDIMSDAEFMRQYNTGASTGACLIRAWQFVSFYDSPSTTSEITYKIQIASSGNQCVIGGRGESTEIAVPTRIQVMEIKG